MNIEEINKNITESILFRSGICGIVLYQEDGKIININEKAKRFMGYASEESVPNNLFDIVFADDIPLMKPYFIGKSEDLHDLEHRYYRKDGSIGWCLASSEVIGIVDGVRIMEGVFTDITKRQQGIKSLEDENLLLHELCDFTVYSKNDALGVVDIKTGHFHLFTCNDRAWGEKRYEGDYQKMLERFFFKRQKDADAYNQLKIFGLDEIVPRVQAEKRVKLKVCLEERRGKRWKEVEYTFFSTRKNQIVFVIQDIHEEEMDRAKLKAAIKEAKEANAAKSDFLANLSHEIRTPMNTIIGLSEVILRQQVPEQMKDDLVCIQNAGKGLLGIINDVLDLSKIKSGKFVLEHQVYHLEMTLTNIMNMISVQLVDKNVKLLLEVAPDIPKTMLGDSLRIKQILLNILGNAVKFTDSGSIRLSVEVAKRKKDQVQLKFIIEDTGIGIKPSEKRRLFEQFYQVDNKKEGGQTGTGLGLTISKNLAKLMHGNISVDSIYGQGATFTVSLWQQYRDEEVLFESSSNNEEQCLILLEDQTVASMVWENLNRLKINAHRMSLEKLNNEGSFSMPFTQIITEEQAYWKYQQFFDVFSPEQVVLLSDYNVRKEVPIEGITTITTQLFPLQFIHFLKGEAIIGSYREKTLNTKKMKDYSGVAVLIVDDTATNRMVAKELLAPYHLTVDLAASGMDAIRKVEKNGMIWCFLITGCQEWTALKRY